MRETDQLDVPEGKLMHQLHQLCLNLMSICTKLYGCGEFACFFFCILPRGLGMVCNVDFAHSCGAGAAVASLNI